jgi:hypothetical protein
VTLTVAGPASGSEDALEPTTFVSEKELEEVRRRIAAGEQPFAQSYDALVEQANAALGQPPRSVVDNDADHTFYSDLEDTADYSNAQEMSRAIYTLAAAWRLGGDDRYAEKALQLIDHWTLADGTYMEPGMTRVQPVARHRTFITMPGIIYGADLIWAYDGWTDRQRTDFAAWTRTIGETTSTVPADDYEYPDGEIGSKNNKESGRQVLIATAGGFVQDPELQEYAFQTFRELLPRQIGAPGTELDGMMLYEYLRDGPTKGGFFYSNFALEAMVHLAELAWQQGIDLYTYENQGVSLRQALDTMVPYNLDPDSWTYSPNGDVDGALVGYFEFAYKRMGEPSYLDVLNKYGRSVPQTYLILGNLTVTHARPADGDGMA